MTTMASIRTPMARSLAQPQTNSISLTQRAFYATPTKVRRVQTPIQSQPKDKIAPKPLEPGTGSNSVQTPVQSQQPSQMNPTSQQNVSRAELTQTKPLLYLTFGLTGVAVFSYFYYDYRKQHMERKWEAMKEEARQNVANRS